MRCRGKLFPIQLGLLSELRQLTAPVKLPGKAVSVSNKYNRDLAPLSEADET